MLIFRKFMHLQVTLDTISQTVYTPQILWIKESKFYNTQEAADPEIKELHLIGKRTEMSMVSKSPDWCIYAYASRKV